MAGEQKPTPEEQYWSIRLERAAEALKTNGFGATVHQTGKEAAEHLVNDMLGKEWKGDVNFGGSLSVVQSGVVPMLQQLPGVDVIATHDPSNRSEEFFRLRRERFICDLYLTSSNAVTMAGQLYNIDGMGNRVASMIYGPQKVVLFVGRNKLCETLEVAQDRVANVAAPMNAMRLGLDTPCAKTGKCMNCKSPSRICSYKVVFDRCKPAGRIHVLLINEDLGF